MVDIDERVVQMKFDSSDFESKTKSTFKILDQLNEKLSFKDAAGSDTFEQVADNVQKMADKAYTIVDRMIDKIKDDIANKLLGFLRENTIGQITSGWSKYADMTTAVATLKSQGYAMEEISNQLERLNYFTDETSYSFTSMVTEIGKFTASGQSLEDATLAMMGIANWAALSGKNANEASRAMYQLSQALGAGAMRMQDWKSIQNLNMDTQEFRKNAIAAAIEVGTLKDNLNGTYTTLVGKKAGTLTFSLNEFADKLTEGAWFTSDVMMKVYGMYAGAVDEIREITEEGGVRIANGIEYEINTTADAISYVKAKNDELINKFTKTNKISTKEADAILTRWKKVEKVTDETVENYAKINKLTKEQALNDMNKQWAEYLEEYNEIFSESEKSAEEAMDDWQEYVSNFGVKAFMSAQEAKTFIEAIESAKDAASTVWTQMFQLIFGNYDEAKSLWTDLANGLYDVFVERLWSLHGIIQEWYDAGGRTTFFQGIYALFGGIKKIIEDIRDAWDKLFGDDQGESAISTAANNLLKFSEHFRISMFRFYNFVKNLEKTPFFTNIATAIHNIIELFKTVKNIIGSVLHAFLPSANTTISILVLISEKLKDITAKLVPSQKTAQNIARWLRGIVSLFRLVGKIILGIIAIVGPILESIFDVLREIGAVVYEIFGAIGDVIFETESAVSTFDALREVGNGLATVIRFLGGILITILGKGLKFVTPLIKKVIDLFKGLASAIKDIFNGNGQGVLNNFTTGIGDFIKRIKNAWNSVDSLKETFEKFRGGSGIGNFFAMIGEMCMNVVRKIGNVITAIFGLEEVVANNQLANNMKTFKDFLQNIFVGIKWLFTNVLFPVFKNIVSGIRIALDDISTAVANGDIVGILKGIKQIFSTLNAYSIWRLLAAIRRLLGSGGILRIIRGIANALKGLEKKWKAEAMNDRANAVIKLTVALGMLLAMMFAISQLDDKQMIKMSDALVYVAKAFGLIIGALIAMSLVVQYARGGLIAFALACLGLIAVMVLVMKAVTLVGEALTEMSNAELNNMKSGGGILVLMSAVIGGLFALFAFIGANASNISSAGVMLIGIGAALFGFAYSLNKVAELITKYDFSTIAQAFMIAAGGIVILAFAIRLLNVQVTDVGKMKLKSAFASGMMTAISTVIMVATFAFILLPALDALSAKMDKFEQYAQGLILFAGMILSISFALTMVNRSAGKWGAISTLGSGIVFLILTQWLKKQFIPFIDELAKINFEEAIGGVTVFSIAILAISASLMLVSRAISNIINAISNLKIGALAVLVLGIISIIATISYMSNLITNGQLSYIAIAAALGILVAIIIAMSLFVRSISNSMRSEKRAEDIRKTIGALIGLIVAIGAIVIGGVIAAGRLFGNDTTSTLQTFAVVVGAILLSIIGIAITLSLFVRSISNNISVTNSDSVVKVINSLIRMLLVVFGSILLLVAGAHLWISMGEKPLSYIVILATTMLTLSLVLVALGGAMSEIIQSISDLITKIGAYNMDRVNRFMNTISLIIISIMGGMALIMLAIGGTYGEGYEWMGAVNIGAVMLAFIAIFTTLTIAFKKIFELLTPKILSQFNKYETIIITFGAIASAIVLSIGAAFMMLMKYQTNMNGGRLLGNTIILIGTFAAIIFILTKSFTTIFNTVKGAKLDGKKFSLIETILGVMLVSILEMALLLEALKGSEVADLTGAISVILVMIGVVGSITGAIILLLKSMKGLTISNTKLGVMLGVLLSIVISLALVGESIIPALANLKDISWSSILAALGGVALIIGAIGGIVVLMAKLLNEDNVKYAIIGTATLFVALFALMGTIAAFGDALIDFISAFEDIDFAFVLRALGAIGGILLEISLLGALNGLFEKATGHMNLVGIVAMLVAFAAIAGIIEVFGESLAKFLSIFDELDFEDISKALYALGGLLGIVTILGVINGALTMALAGLNVLGMIEMGLALLGLAYILEIAGPKLAEFFKLFQDIDWEDIEMGLLVLGAIGLSSAVLGSMMIASAPGIIMFIGVILALSAALYILASAYAKFKSVSDEGNPVDSVKDDSKQYNILGKKSGTSYAKGFNSGYTTTEQIKSPSKVFKKYGKFIDQGLINGLKSNITGVKSASSILANATNDTFCSELGIASPSKVFYENGRFVIRGLINGMDSESVALNNQGYDIGTNISDGIADGLEGTDWGGIFGDMDMESTIAEALANGGTGVVDYLNESIFGDGSEEFDWNMLTEEEQKALRDAEGLLYQINRAWEANGEVIRYNGENLQYFHNNEEDVERYTHDVQELQDTIDALRKKGTKTTGLGGTVTSSITKAFTSGNISDVMSNLGGDVGKKIINAISDFIGGDGKTKIKETAKSLGVDLFGNGEGDKGELTDTVNNAGKSAGSSAATGFIDSMKSVLNGDNSVTTAIGGFIDNITAKIKAGIGSSSLVKWVMKAMNWLNILDDDEYNKYLIEIGEKTLDQVKKEDFINAKIDEYTNGGGLSYYSTDEARAMAEADWEAYEKATEDAVKKSESVYKYFPDLNERVKEEADTAGVEKTATEIAIAIAKAISNPVYYDEAGEFIVSKYEDFMNEICKILQIRSPSRVFLWIGEMINAGFVEGIDESAKQVFKAMANLTQGVLDETDPLYDAINPRLTPVLDDSSIKNGIATANKSFNAMNPQVDATVSAYMKSMPNYSGDFESLENSIYNTNVLMGEILSMLESGDVTTVNVEVAPVPGNIYDTVINTNRERFRRTGINGFMI